MLNNKTAIVILVLAAIIIFGGVCVGNMVESMATEIADTRNTAMGR